MSFFKNILAKIQVTRCQCYCDSFYCIRNRACSYACITCVPVFFSFKNIHLVSSLNRCLRGMDSPQKHTSFLENWDSERESERTGFPQCVLQYASAYRFKNNLQSGRLRDRLHFLSGNVCVCDAESNGQRVLCFSGKKRDRKRGGPGEKESAGNTSCVGLGQKDYQGLTLRRHHSSESQRGKWP